MRLFATHSLTSLLVLLFAVLGPLVGQGSWVLCREADGKTTVEAFHMVGACGEVAQHVSDAGATVACSYPCSDSPLIVAGTPLPQGAERAAFELQVVGTLLSRLVLLPPQVPSGVRDDRCVMTGSPPRLPLIDSIILLV